MESPAVMLGKECALSTWMVVDDEPDIYELLLAMFEFWGIDGVAFVDGSEAIAWIEDVDAMRIQTDLPAMAIIDIRLPDPALSGIDVAARLRQSPILHNIGICLITAYHMSPAEEDEAGIVSQADMLLYKPLPHPAEFRRLLEGILERRAALANVGAEDPADVPPGPPFTSTSTL